MTANPWRSIGVDWDSGSWITVGYPDTGQPEAAVCESIETLWNTHGDDAERIVVDVPIGLCGGHDTTDGCIETDEEWSRRCDDLTRGSSGHGHHPSSPPPVGPLRDE